MNTSAVSVKNPIIKASLLIVLSGILYGFLGFFGTKIIEEGSSITMMLFWRFTLAGIWILALYSLDHFKQPNIAKIQAKTLACLFGISAIGYSGASGFFFKASEYIGTGIAMVIFFSYPILVALYAWIAQKHKLSLKTYLLLTAITAGLILLKGLSGSSASIGGIFLGLASALSYAFYIIGSKKFCHLNINSKLLTAIVCFSCSMVFIVLAYFDHSISMPSSWKAWGYILALGIVATAIPIQLMLDGLKSISSLRASIISVLEPLVTVLLGVLLLNENITALQLVGIAIILSSAALVQFQKEL